MPLHAPPPLQGIGEAAALQFAALGANLVLTDLDQGAVDQVAAAARQLGVAAVTVAGDITAPGAAERVVAAAVGRFGTIHVLVNNAGFTWVRGGRAGAGSGGCSPAVWCDAGGWPHSPGLARAHAPGGLPPPLPAHTRLAGMPHQVLSAGAHPSLFSYQQRRCDPWQL
jgi:hypothetical protein